MIVVLLESINIVCLSLFMLNKTRMICLIKLRSFYEVVVFPAAAKAPRLKVFFVRFGTTINYADYVKVTRQLVASRKVRRAIPVQGG